MIFPRRGQVWTYKERTRFNGLMGGVVGLFPLVIGIVFLSWPLILIGSVIVASSVMIWVMGDRKYRDEP